MHPKLRMMFTSETKTMAKPQVVSPENKKLARYIAGVFGGQPHVTEYAHDTSDLTIGILWCADRPIRGVTSYSTVRLSDYPMFKDATEYPARIEIVGACATERDAFPNVLAAAAFCVMRTGTLLCPGALLPDYVSLYFPDTTVPHLYFTSPFLWADGPKRLDCGTKRVSWLMAIPISDDESTYLRQHGPDALEDLFVQRQIDVYDLQRQGVA